MRAGRPRRQLIALTGVALAVAGSLAGAAWAAESHHEAGLTINWWSFAEHAPPLGWFFVDFALFAAGLVYFTAKPVAQAFGQRHLHIKQAVSDAATAHAKASARHHEYRNKLTGADSEIQQLQGAGEHEGVAERDRLVAEAQAYAAQLQRDGASLAEQETRSAQARLRHFVLRASLSRAEALLRERLDQALQQRLVDQAIAELESGRSLQPSAPRSAAKAALGGTP